MLSQRNNSANKLNLFAAANPSYTPERFIFPADITSLQSQSWGSFMQTILRNFVPAGRLLSSCFLFGAVISAPVYAQDCFDETDVQLVNGNIHTMDSDFSVASTVRIANGRIVAVGESTAGPCTKVIDLDGRTVIPGIIDNHVHILLSGIRPGHETRAIENATTVAEAAEVIRERAQGVPEGEFISAIGGLSARQFDEERLPNLEELDAAAPNHPVYIHQSFNGPGTTNSLGKAFFEANGVPVDANGYISGGEATRLGSEIATNHSHDAFNAMNTVWGFEDRKQTTSDVIDYFTSKGITTAHSVGGSQGRGPGYFDTSKDHDIILSLLSEGNINMRLRLYHNAFGPELYTLLENVFPNFGGDLIKNVGQGEHLVQRGPEAAAIMDQDYIDRAMIIAERGWQIMEHTFNDVNVNARAEAWGIVNEKFPIADLRWSADHINTISVETINKLNAAGGSLRLHITSHYLTGAGGPPYRFILDNRVFEGNEMHVGAGSDASQAGPINPWLHIYFMTTGRDVKGELANDGQQVTRQEALWLYTAANGWYSREENDLGSIEVGKFGDLVVLNNNYFDDEEVSDEDIKDISSVLTLVGGRIVHDLGMLD